MNTTPFAHRRPVPEPLLKAMRHTIFSVDADKQWLEDEPVSGFIIVGHVNRGYRPYYSLWEERQEQILPSWLSRVLLGKEPKTVTRFYLRRGAFNNGNEDASPTDLYPAIRRYKGYDCLDGDVQACEDYRKIAGVTK